MAPNELPEISHASDVELKALVVALQRQVFMLLLALIVVSGTVTVYLYRQASLLHKDIEVSRPQAVQVITALNQNRQWMMNFLGQIGTYSQTHPEFEQQVMVKNGLVPPAGSTPPGAPPKK